MVLSNSEINVYTKQMSFMNHKLTKFVYVYVSECFIHISEFNGSSIISVFPNFLMKQTCKLLCMIQYCTDISIWYNYDHN